MTRGATVTRGATLALLACAALLGCDDGDPALPPGETPCGSGAAVMEVGDGNPFVPNPDQRYRVEAGRQGGFHTHVSLRAQGALDPDLVDVSIQLKDGETIIARHVTAEWLLHIDRAGPWCVYPTARLVLLDEEGGLFDREAALAATGRPLTLEARFESPDGDAVITETVELDGSDL